MRRKERERAEARRLRESGWTLREIANCLGVSISSVSTWVRDIPRGPDPATPEPAAPSPVERSGESRSCGRCERILPVESFNRHALRGRQHWCRDCFIEYFRGRGDFHRRQSAAAKTRRRIAGRRFIDEYLSSHACADCGATDPLILEFDHLDTKYASVSVLLADGWSLTRLKRELGLCDVVCVNCHRRRTARRAPSWRTDPEGLESNRHLLPGERRNMRFISDVLSNARCADCGTCDLLILEFDHVGLKTANVTTLARRGCRLEVLKKEIEQCEVRCANCHRRRTRRGARSRSVAA